MAKLKIGSLFSGTGALDMAVEQVTGATPAWFCEFDEAPTSILNHHWPQVHNYRDVTKIDWADIPPVDIITGGSPCQDLSTAGKRAGMTEGTRSNLWVNMREAIAVIKPRLVVWENVRGALSASATSDSDLEQQERLLGGEPTGHLRALGRVLGDLAEIGYDARWTTLRASDVGAPHHRARVFLIAYPTDTGCVGLQAARWGGGYGAQVAGAIGGEGALPELEYLPTLRASDSKCGDYPAEHRRVGPSIAAVSVYFPHLPTPNTMDHLPAREGEAREKQLRRGDMNGSRRASMGNLREDVIYPGDGGIYGRYEPVVRRWEQATGTTAPNPTELNRNGKPHLNVEFAEWMMGIPKGWVTGVPGLSRAQQLKAIGNGVVSQQAAAALKVLLGMDYAAS